jgi:hypothetical protein
VIRDRFWRVGPHRGVAGGALVARFADCPFVSHKPNPKGSTMRGIFDLYVSRDGGQDQGQHWSLRIWLAFQRSERRGPHGILRSERRLIGLSLLTHSLQDRQRAAPPFNVYGRLYSRRGVWVASGVRCNWRTMRAKGESCPPCSASPAKIVSRNECTVPYGFIRIVLPGQGA